MKIEDTWKMGMKPGDTVGFMAHDRRVYLEVMAVGDGSLRVRCGGDTLISIEPEVANAVVIRPRKRL